jgi:hypothetical protein
MESRKLHLQVHPVGCIEIRAACQPFRSKSHPSYGGPRVSLILEHNRATDLNRRRAGPTMRLTTGQPLPRIEFRNTVLLLLGVMAGSDSPP